MTADIAFSTAKAPPLALKKACAFSASPMPNGIGAATDASAAEHFSTRRP